MYYYTILCQVAVANNYIRVSNVCIYKQYSLASNV
jgi:hypothetical protein